MASQNKQQKFRLQPGTDAALDDWMQQFRNDGMLTDVIRIALYQLSGLPMPDNLVLLAQRMGMTGRTVTPALQPVGIPSELLQLLADNIITTREIAQAMLQSREFTVQMVQAAQVTVGPVQTETHESSGIEMSRPRTRTKLARGPVVEDAARDVTDEFDAVALAREMARSVGNFGKSKQSATGAEE